MQLLSLHALRAQEYNICFTTVRRPEDGGLAPLPAPSPDMAVLPKARARLAPRSWGFRV